MTTTVPTRHSTLEITDDLAVFTLNRPEVRNCLSLQLSDELVAALEEIRRADSVKFLVLRGAGETFCAGDDLREMGAGAWGDASQYFERVRYYQQMAYALEGLNKITIAAVERAAPPGSRDSWAGAWPRSST